MLQKEDAIAVVGAAKNGADAMAAIFDEAPGCNLVPLRFRVGREVAAANVEGEHFTVRAVEAKDMNDDSIVVYWLTAERVLPPKKKGISA